MDGTVTGVEYDRSGPVLAPPQLLVENRRYRPRSANTSIPGIWREATALLDSEHLRRAVGEVAVPYGSCSEPSNVAAGGHD